MLAGHLGVALTAARIEPRLNLGLLAAASLLLDGLLWMLVLAGIETVTIPADYARTRQPLFVFPFSHGLLAAGLWSALAAVATAGLLWRHDRAGWVRPALVVGAVVFSHWLLDLLVHRPELPVAGAASPRLGLALWDALPLALAIEGALLLAGLIIFLPHCGLSRGRRIGVATLGLTLLAFTVVGMTLAPAPPSATAMATSSLAMIAVLVLALGWLARTARTPPA